MYQASQKRYHVIPYRRCGDSGLCCPLSRWGWLA